MQGIACVDKWFVDMEQLNNCWRGHNSYVPPLPSNQHMRFLNLSPYPVEGLNCKRPIQCLASSKILTPPPPHRPASVLLGFTVYPPGLWCGGRTHSLGGEGGEGSIFCKTPLASSRFDQTALYSTYVSTLCRTLWGDPEVVFFPK